MAAPNSPSPPDPGLEDLIRQLAAAEEALQASLGSEVDAVLLGDGQPYLLHKAREALSRAEVDQARLAAIVESSDDGIYSTALDGTVQTWNAAAKAIYGYAADEIIDRNLSVLIPSEEIERYHLIMERARQGKPTSRFEAIRLRKDGEKIWVSLSIFPLRNDEGQVIGISKISRDITDRKEREEALAMREKALNEVSQGVLISNEKRGIIYVNEGFERLTGYSAAEVMGCDCKFLQGPETDPNTVAKLSQALHSGRSFDGEILNYRKDGKPFWNELTISPVRDDQGVLLSFIGIQRDVTARKEGMVALEKSEQKQRKLILELKTEQARLVAAQSVAKIGSWATDLSTMQVIWSAESYRIFETSPEQFHPTHEGFLELVHPEDRATVNNAFLRSGNDHAPHLVEHRILLPDGRIKFIEERWRMFFDDQDRPSHAYGTCQDISERKRAEARFRRLVDSNAQAVFFWNRNGEVSGGNDAFLNLVGYTREDLEAGRISWMALTPPEYAHVDQQGLKEIELKGACTPYEKEYIRKDGSRVPILLGATVFEDNNEEGMCFVVDLTDQKAAEEARSLSAERLQLATKAARVGVWDYDFISDFMSWDEQMFSLYGVSPDTAPPGYDRWRSRLHPEDRERAETELQDAQRPGGKPFDTEFRITRSNDGHTRHIRALASVVWDESGHPKRMIGTNWDVTEARDREQALALALKQQKELTHAAQAGEEAKSQFLAVMSHEIRTPLNGVLGFAEMLTQETSLSPQGREYLQIISRSGESLLQIIDDILDFSRLDSGGLKVKNSAFPLGELVDDIEAFFATRMREKNLGFHISVDRQLSPQIFGDDGRIRQVLINLIGNALKFTEAGSIALNLRRRDLPSGLWIEFCVEDTGIGIPMEKCNAVFEAFTQADQTTARRHGGSGLGLTISRRLAELMQGTLEVESQPGKGSKFFLRIPLKEANTVESSPSGPESPSLDKEFAVKYPLSVLAVEDDKANLQLIVAMMRRLGYMPLEARNGVEAVDIYEKERPACVFIDLQMPEMDGIEATKRIREIEKSLQLSPAFVAALTANILPEDRDRCFQAGVNFYLNKPVKMQALADVLVQAFQSKEMNPRHG